MSSQTQKYEKKFLLFETFKTESQTVSLIIQELLQRKFTDQITQQPKFQCQLGPSHYKQYYYFQPSIKAVVLKQKNFYSYLLHQVIVFYCSQVQYSQQEYFKVLPVLYLSISFLEHLDFIQTVFQRKFLVELLGG